MIILIGIIIILLIIKINNSYEHFDKKIENINYESCGSYCTNKYNCIGFAYDNSKNNCYLSNSPIVGEPISNSAKSIYYNEYSKDYNICNKPFPIKKEDKYKLNENMYNKNVIYYCKDKIEDNQKIIYKTIFDNKIKNYNNKNEIYNEKNKFKYELEEF